MLYFHSTNIELLIRQHLYLYKRLLKWAVCWTDIKP